MGKNVEQGWPVKHDRGVDKGAMAPNREIVVKQIVYCRTVSPRGNRRFDNESRRQQQQLITVQTRRPHPNVAAHFRAAFTLLQASAYPPSEQSRQENEPLSGSKIAYWLVQVNA